MVRSLEYNFLNLLEIFINLDVAIIILDKRFHTLNDAQTQTYCPIQNRGIVINMILINFLQVFFTFIYFGGH